jgi:hypothetical protein
MKNVLKAVFAHHLLKHRQHRRFLHSLGAPVLALGRTKGMLMFGALALGAEYLRRRKAARTEPLRQYPQ